MDFWKFLKAVFDKFDNIGFGKTMDKIVTKQSLSRAASFNLLVEMIIASVSTLFFIGALLSKEFNLAFTGYIICIIFGVLCLIYVKSEDRWGK